MHARLRHSLAKGACVNSAAFGFECEVRMQKKITRDLHPSVVVKRISIVVGFFVEMGLFLLNCFWARKHIAIPFLCRL